MALGGGNGGFGKATAHTIRIWEVSALARV